MSKETRCITCGRSLPKKTDDIYVQPVSGTLSGTFRSATVEADLHTRADCARHTNAPFILSHRTNGEGFITRFTVWDGESYRERFFCTNRCAIKHANASAITGQRFNWNGRFFTQVCREDS